MMKILCTASLYLLITCLTSVNADSPVGHGVDGITIMNEETKLCMSPESLSVGSPVIQSDCKIASKWLQLTPSPNEGGPILLSGSDSCLSFPPDTSSNIAEIATCNDQDRLQKFSRLSYNSNDAIVGYNGNCLTSGDDGLTIEITRNDLELGDKRLWTTGIVT